MEIVNTTKAVIFTFLGWMSSMLFYFAPIHGIMFALSVAFALSFFFGIVAGIRIQGESVDLKKAIDALKELAVYFVFLAALFVIGEKMKGSEWIFQFLSVVTWGMIYFYIANWFKNLKRLFPGSRCISFLFFVFNLEFLKKVPYLKEFEDYEKKGK